MASALQTRLEAIDGASSDAAQQLRALLTGEGPNDGESVKVKESALTRLCEVLVSSKDADALSSLLLDLRPLFAVIPKAKTAKIIRTVIDAISRVPNSTQRLLEVCRAQVEWAAAEKRSFLRQRLETRLAGLLLEIKDYPAALSLLSKLLSEVKKLDDKLLLVDIYLLESQAHHALKNLPKSRASLTAGRAAANAIYVPPSTQADLDTQSGLLHSEEGDFTTAYSYYYEAYEQYAALSSPRALPLLKLMLLAKIMKGNVAEVPAIINSKTGATSTESREVASMRAVAEAYDSRSLHDFQAVLEEYPEQLTEDVNVSTHLAQLYSTLLEKNLLRLIEPFSRVEVAHIARLIDLPLPTVEAKLSQMILDKQLAGTLDQGAGLLEVWEEGTEDEVFPPALAAFENIGRAVDLLHARSLKLMAAAN
ncbi:RPN6 [Auxenochlorella protothecoides x Auxenochlorella symbiontica]